MALPPFVVYSLGVDEGLVVAVAITKKRRFSCSIVIGGCQSFLSHQHIVIPAQAGIPLIFGGVPSFEGMTDRLTLPASRFLLSDAPFPDISKNSRSRS
jgi:hypothetical protein